MGSKIIIKLAHLLTPKLIVWLRRSIKFAALFFPLLLAGCAVNVNTNKYSLNNICIRPHCSHSCYTLLVANPTAQAGYDTDQMLYMQCPYQIKAYSYNRWVAPPHEMLATLLAQSLRNTCYFNAVVTPPFAGTIHYRVESRLVKLQHEFFCSPSRVRMILHVVLVNSITNNAIAERVIERVICAPMNNPYGGVLAANVATKQILEEVADFVIFSIEHHPCGVTKKKIKIKEKIIEEKGKYFEVSTHSLK